MSDIGEIERIAAAVLMPVYIPSSLHVLDSIHSMGTGLSWMTSKWGAYKVDNE